MSSPIITLSDVTTGYRSRRAVHTVSAHLTASLHTGELTCLLGPNGAGKSTLLRTLTADQPPLGGTVSLGGKPLHEYTAAQRARQVSIVLTSQTPNLNMSVREIVALGRSPYTNFWGRLTPADEVATDEAIHLIGIGELAHRPLRSLSDGERQKVMLAKALAQQTPVILLDEPTAFLDYPSKIQTLLLLRRLTRTLGKTVLLSTHDLDHAVCVADRLWLLDKQHGLTDGSPAELGERGDIAAYFDCPELHYEAASRRFVMTMT